MNTQMLPFEFPVIEPVPRGTTDRLAATPMPHNIAKLPSDERGYPIPKFVATRNGIRDFRLMDYDFRTQCIRDKICWICGEPLRKYFSFIAGPMSCLNRTVIEPPSHIRCAHYAVRVCPFLAVPNMRRNERALPDNVAVDGKMHPGNPGVCAMWITNKYVVWEPRPGEVLLMMGEPARIIFWAEGRALSRAEIQQALQDGYHRMQSLVKNCSRRDQREMQSMLNRAKIVCLAGVP